MWWNWGYSSFHSWFISDTRQNSSKITFLHSNGWIILQPNGKYFFIISPLRKHIIIFVVDECWCQFINSHVGWWFAWFLNLKITLPIILVSALIWRVSQSKFSHSINIIRCINKNIYSWNSFRLWCEFYCDPRSKR